MSKFKADLEESDIISSVAEKTDVDYAEARRFIRAYEDVIKQAIIDGKSIQMRGFMNMYVSTYTLPNRWNPKSGKRIGKVFKKRVRFKVCEQIQKIIDKQAREESNAGY